jgi:hypothetical protein
MRLGRKLAEGIAVDREADRLAETVERPEHDVTPVVRVEAVEDVPVEAPVRA